jgi:hypothetical protein
MRNGIYLPLYADVPMPCMAAFMCMSRMRCC